MVFLKRSNAKKPLVMLSLMAAAVSQANAGEPAEIKLGGIDLTPTLNISESRSDNIYSSNNNAESSNIFVINPGILAELAHGDSMYSFNAELSDGTYSDGLAKDDDYTDYSYGANADIALNSSNMIMLAASMASGHEDRGSGVTEGTSGFDVPIEYDEDNYSAGYRLGNDDSVISVELGVSRTDKEYTNFEEFTDIRNYEKDAFTITGYYELAPKTDLLVEYVQADYDYEVDPFGLGLDSDEDQMLIGLVWEATANTTGTAKIGRLDKEFDSAVRDEFSGTIWSAQVDWTPTEQSIINFTTSQLPKETNVGNGNFIDGTMTSVSWKQAWTSAISTTVNFGTGEDDYDETNRSDDVTNYGISLDYEFRRWMSVGLAYKYDERDSNVDVFDYDRNVYSLTVSLSL
jgi:hypothetical protein